MKRAEIAAYELFCGIDVGKARHYAVVLDRDGDDPVMRRPVAQDEAELRALLGEVASLGRALVVVDQFGSFGRLTVEVARSEGLDVAHMPPGKFGQVAATYGEGKSDAKDAFIIADTARSQPRHISPLPERGEALAELKALSVARDVAVCERSRLYNRIHDAMGQVCPALEQLFDKEKLHNDLEIRLVAKYGGPAGFRRAGRARASRWAASLRYHAANGPAKVDEVFEAIGRQSVAMAASGVLEDQIRKYARRVIELNAEEAALDAAIARAAALVPEVAVLKSVPGIGDVWAAVIAAEVGDVSRFADASHLASYGGVAPVKDESGSSVSRKKKRKGGNRRLKNALINSAERAVACDDVARAYYDKKRGEDEKGHKQAIRALARRRVDLIYALLSDGALYEPSAGAAS